jgi:hypothetical protein
VHHRIHIEYSTDTTEPNHIQTTARGEDNYIFEITSAQRSRSAFPPLWIDPKASDHQVTDKLSREFEQAFHPDSSPDDLAVPNVQTEANQPQNCGRIRQAVLIVSG